MKEKQSKINDSCSEECDARRLERKGKEKAARRTYMPKRNRHLFHGQNNTKITAVALAKQHEENDNRCFTDKNNTKKRKEILYRHKAGGEGNKEAHKKKKGKKEKKKGPQQVIAAAFALPPLNSTKTNKAENATRCRGFRAMVVKNFTSGLKR